MEANTGLIIIDKIRSDSDFALPYISCERDVFISKFVPGRGAEPQEWRMLWKRLCEKEKEVKDQTIHHRKMFRKTLLAHVEL